jgi:geranylgeranyl diphosphate synthase type I
MRVAIFAPAAAFYFVSGPLPVQHAPLVSTVYVPEAQQGFLAVGSPRASIESSDRGVTAGPASVAFFAAAAAAALAVAGRRPVVASLAVEAKASKAPLGSMDVHRVAVEQSIYEAIDMVGLDRFRGAMKHLIDGGGKRLRAVLPSLVGEACGKHHEGHHDLGAAIEIIHNFTLIHDDIMDDDDIRRGRPAVHVAYDVPTAINAGDAMHVLAFEILSSSKNISDAIIRDVVLIVSRMVRKVSEGQQLDMEFETRDDEVSEAEYLHMIEGKTAAMFETCAQTGALLAGADAAMQEDCRMWGLETGLCFQLMDDMIDLTADTATIGKPTGSDILGGKRTLVAIHALRQDPAALPTFHAIFGRGEAGTDRLPEAIKELEAVGSLEYGRREAMAHHAAAHLHLAKLPQSDARAVLERLTDWQLERMA